jgi:hypothetical protein
VNIYAQLLDNSKVGSKVGLELQNGKTVAGGAISKGRFGIVKSVRSGVAFIELLADATPAAAAEAGSAMAVTVELPVSATGYLSVTVEDD